MELQLTQRMQDWLKDAARRRDGWTGHNHIGGGTWGALARRGLIGMGRHPRGMHNGDRGRGAFITPAGWAYLAEHFGIERPADAGRLDIEQAHAEACAHDAQVDAVDAWMASRIKLDRERREAGCLSLEEALEYADQMRRDTSCVGLPNWPAPATEERAERRQHLADAWPANAYPLAEARRVVEGVIVGGTETAEGSLPRDATHPNVAAAREALDNFTPAILTDDHDVTDPAEDEQQVRGYLIDPREGDRVAVYWLEGGRVVRRDQLPPGTALDCIADRLRAAGWTVEKLLRSSQCVFALRPAATRPAPLVVRMAPAREDLDRIRAKADQDRAKFRTDMDARQAAEHERYGATDTAAVTR